MIMVGVKVVPCAEHIGRIIINNTNKKINDNITLFLISETSIS